MRKVFEKNYSEIKEIIYYRRYDLIKHCSERSTRDNGTRPWIVPRTHGDKVLRALFERATNSSKHHRGANSIPP